MGARLVSETGPGLLLGLADGGLEAGIAALVIGDAAFLLDVLVELLTHGLVVVKGNLCLKVGGGVKR